MFFLSFVNLHVVQNREQVKLLSSDDKILSSLIKKVR